MAGNDNELDNVLRRRAAPPPPVPGWERAIIDAAFAGGSQRLAGCGFRDRIRAWGDELGGLFILPRPAYALAACLVIGIAAGLTAEPVFALMQQDQDIFIYLEDDTI